MFGLVEWRCTNMRGHFDGGAILMCFDLRLVLFVGI